MPTQANSSIAPPLSQSRLNLMGCPHLYQKRVIEGLQESDNPFAIRGREFHDVRADYVVHLVATRQRKDPAKLDELLNDNAISEDAYQLLTNSRDEFEIDPESVLHIEQRLYLGDDFEPVEIPKFAAYEGKPDLVLINGAEARIPDYKTTFQIFDADTPQGRLYSLLVMIHYPFVERVVFELHFVRYGSAKRKAEYTRDQISHLKGRVARDRDRQLALHALTERGEVAPAIPGEACIYCPLLMTTCPNREINDYAVSTPEDLLKEEVFLKARIKRVSGLLKTHVSVEGPVSYSDANGHTYSREFELKERTTFPLIPVLETLIAWTKRTGEDITAKLKIGATELKPLLKAKKRAELATEVEGVKIVEQYTQFSLKGSEDDDAA
ncbi:MAG TPA: PD-(D/E)XK nuclease family protein [Candidatus Angelobacter sp.]|nr:PD-(D/E)XK nuclease family protein [Candidatus Angelobacter sp.]